MKSGKYFKIGKSNCAERREFELRILLPEKLELAIRLRRMIRTGSRNIGMNDSKINGKVESGSTFLPVM